ncbi:divergent polysaccharide deacetylase family protein [Sporomusa sp.]|uniref:divergent polysaccharide deacetylase family protein n=1 Tax=Sporomusa sp. TaxID=2078658 RepID=UPI002B780FA3|nr:divergent polysaccharide deacetylase family protein [Sporomusa sp.]HWR45552.1 divergent polysaccharide deacetylase family protein [Sporomusa sp.]
MAKKAKKSNNFKWILALVAIFAAIIFYQTGHPPERSPAQPEPGYNLEKTGAGVVLDFTATAAKVHTAVDSGLTNAKLTPKEVKEAKREVPRKGVEGVIRWHTRSMLVVLPENVSPEGLEQALTPFVASAGGKVIGTEPDTYNGAPAVRIDVGIKDILNSEPLTLVTDRIYIVKDKGVLPAKPKAEARQGDMAIVIDDFGYTREPIAGFADMGRPITFSVLPYRQYSNEAAARALSAGHLVMLHLPLEPLSTAEEVEPTVIRVEMSDEDIRQTVDKAIASIPGLKGVNNHQGSKATADRRVMKTVLSVIKAHNLFFIDSRTNGKTVAAEVSRQLGLRTGENELFLDNSSDVELIKKQLRKAVDMAHKNGNVTVIGHARPNTVIAVRDMIPEMEAAGIRLVYADQLVR